MIKSFKKINLLNVKSINIKFDLIFILFIFFNFSGYAQNHHVEGRVVDKITKENLAFVNIIINNNGNLGTTTDIDGRFVINSNIDIKTLTFSFVGYEKKEVIIDKNTSHLNVKLASQNIELEEVIINANINPANRIIDSVLKYHDSNDPEKLDSYSYKIYDRMIMTMDTLLFSDDDIDQQKLKEKFRDNDLMIMETVSEQFHKLPNINKKNIIANKISGLTNPKIFYLLEAVQSIDFYDDFITVFDKKYVNPISKGSQKKYWFVLESALSANENDSVFLISFRPRRNTNFNALCGTITIHSDNWAIQNVKAEPADKNTAISIKIQQLYEKVDSIHWFPKQIYTNITAKLPIIDVHKHETYSLLGIGKSYLSEIKINPELDNRIFNNITIDVNPDAGSVTDEYFNVYRYDSLNTRIASTYRFADSIGKVAHLDALSNMLEPMMRSGNIPIGFINLDFNKILDYNIGNKFFLGLGFNTNERFSKVLSIGAYGGYWFGAKKTNYGMNACFNILRSKDMKFNLSGDYKYEKTGNYGFTEDYFVLSPLHYKYYYVNSSSLNTSFTADYSTRFGKIFKGFIKFNVSDKRLNGYSFITNDSIYKDRFRLSTLEFKLKIAFKEELMLTSEGLTSLGSSFPVIWISYQKSLKHLFDNPFNYDKIQFQVSGERQILYLGNTSITIQAGYINGVAPITDLFNIFCSWSSFGLYAPESFNTMRLDEFFCDRFAALFFSHNFHDLLFSTKRFKPELILITNIAWGDLKNKETHKGIEFHDMDKGYYESGIIIDNLINTYFIKLGIGGFYRYGPYSFENAWDNFSWKFSLTINL